MKLINNVNTVVKQICQHYLLNTKILKINYKSIITTKTKLTHIIGLLSGYLKLGVHNFRSLALQFGLVRPNLRKALKSM